MRYSIPKGKYDLTTLVLDNIVKWISRKRSIDKLQDNYSLRKEKRSIIMICSLVESRNTEYKYVYKEWQLNLRKNKKESVISMKWFVLCYGRICCTLGDLNTCSIFLVSL